MTATCPVVPRDGEIGQTIHTCRMPKCGVGVHTKSLWFSLRDMDIHLWSVGKVLYCSQYVCSIRAYILYSENIG